MTEHNGGNIRRIRDTREARPTLEGAGVRLQRVFGGDRDARQFDPFLLMDHFGSDNPDDYLAGFPWHPHRGIETVTYMVEGAVEHKDSLGNGGIIRSGDVQWMTAGGGIIHQEMPQHYEGRSCGFQLWVNLPAAHKMMSPRYREVTSDEIPVSTPHEGVESRVICGRSGEIDGPVNEMVVDVAYSDITQTPGQEIDYPTNPGHTVLAYVFEGVAGFDPEAPPVGEGRLLHFTGGDRIHVQTTDSPARFLLMTGQPLKEPIAWRGPIVMNTNRELDTAFEQFRNGTFLNH